VTEYQRIEKLFWKIVTDAEITVEQYRDLIDVGSQSLATLTRMVDRDFRLFLQMFQIVLGTDLTIDTIVDKQRSTLVFVEEGYRYVLGSYPDIAKKDLILRYQYVKSKEEGIKYHLKFLILENLQDALIEIKSYKSIENNSAVRIISEAILKNRRLLITSKYGKSYKVEPIKLFYHLGYWYLASFLANDLCKQNRIKINSIETITLLEKENITPIKTMVQKRILRFDPWGDEKSKKSCKITLRLANKYIYNFFKHKQYLISQKLYKKDGAYFVTFTYNDPMEVAPVIFQWLNKITIEDIECELGNEKEILMFLKENMEGFLQRHSNFFQQI